MIDAIKYGVSVYLKSARHLLVQRAKCVVGRSFVYVNPADTRVRDPFGALLTQGALKAMPGIIGASSLSAEDWTKALVLSGIDPSVFYVTEALARLSHIHDQESVATWDSCIRLQFQELFPPVPWMPEMTSYVRGGALGPYGMPLLRHDDLGSIKHVDFEEAMNRLTLEADLSAGKFDFELQTLYGNLGKEVVKRFTSHNKCPVDSIQLKRGAIKEVLDRIDTLTKKPWAGENDYS